MRRKLVITVLILFFVSVFLTSCFPISGDNSKDNSKTSEQYNQVINRLNVTQQQLNTIQLQANQLQTEVTSLKQKYEYVGGTPTDTAKNIVKQYHETHIYSAYDLFVCSDMALDVWDMLKAQGIDALIKVGNVDKKIDNLADSNHAWVLAEVSPASYLALETTGGYAVLQNDNPLYYWGWTFDNPNKFKRFEDLENEYNIRAESANQMIKLSNDSRQSLLAESANALQIANNLQLMTTNNPNLGSTITHLVDESIKCGEYKGRVEQLDDLVNVQKQQLEYIASEMKGLTQ